jgi:dienelactone hydrolase
MQTRVANQNRIAAIGYCFGGAVCQAFAYSGTPLRGVVCFHTSLLPTSKDGLARTKASGVKFLICQGADDLFVKSADVMKLQNTLEQAGISCQVIEYPGAIHAFSNPQADALARANGLQGVAYNANADKESWAAMREFLSGIFK